MDWITQFLGRLHPLVVHFPIGILFVGFFFECLSQIKGYKKLRVAVQPALLVGVVFAIVSVITGLYLSDEGGYDDELLERHKTLGIVTAVFGVAVYALRLAARAYFQDKARKRMFYFVLFVPLIILVSLTGHFGGSMTHGEDYLFAIAGNGEEAVDPAMKLQTISNIDNAEFYPDIIQPILESRCYSCHSSRKQKGDLRLDGIDFIRRGGESGAIVEPGIPDSSSLFVRLMLPLEHDDHMPPNEKPQPSSVEIALIQSWIKEGGDFQTKVSALHDRAKIKTYFTSLVEQSRKEMLIPEEAVKQGDEKAIAGLKKRGVIVLSVSAGSNYLSISFVNKRTLSAEDISLLLPLKEQIIWLNLARTTIGDENMNTIAALSRLRHLSLEYTAVTDQGLQTISTLPDLKYLNIVGTKISDNGISHLSAAKNLKQLFVYQTAVTDSGIELLQSASPGLEIDTGGYALPKLLSDSVITEFAPG